jgi:thiol:disulfide interchange protein DsbA
MRKILYYILLPAILFFSSLWIISYTSPTSAALGYQEISPPINTEPRQPALIEFFSYGCPACYAAEPQLIQWLSEHPSVHLQRIPVLFQTSWLIYARTYYAVKQLGVSEKVTLAFFKAIHDEGRDLSTPEKIANFLSEQGVEKSKFLDAFNFSPAIDGQVNRGDKLARQYKVFAIPTFVVNGKYLTNADMAGGSNQKLFAILDTLVTWHSPQQQKN